MNFYDKKFQQRCILMLSVLMLWVIFNFSLNTIATFKRNEIREEIAVAHHRIEVKIDRLTEKVEALNNKK